MLAAWYIPPKWLSSLDATEYQQATDGIKNITGAALLASRLLAAMLDGNLERTGIPRIIHQTWKSTDIEHIPEKDAILIESWLQYATGQESPMAYFMWDDAGAEDLMRIKEPDIFPYYNLLPKPVTKSDVFRVAVCNTIGGIYADIDTRLLRDPVTWVEKKDLTPWKDPETGVLWSNTKTQTDLILGIEADTPEHSDDYWRMGYTYPVQLTQWALASAADHAILSRFLDNFKARVKGAIAEALPFDPAANPETLTADVDKLSKVQKVLRSLDPLDFTGPAAITNATMTYLSEKADLRWQSLSGLEDGGRSKLVLDTLILPITGFSPGRGKYGNMGSKPTTDHSARLQHLAQGSWRKFDFKVQVGKLCRTLFGQCRDWSKVPDG